MSSKIDSGELSVFTAGVAHLSRHEEMRSLTTGLFQLSMVRLLMNMKANRILIALGCLALYAFIGVFCVDSASSDIHLTDFDRDSGIRFAQRISRVGAPPEQ